MILVCVCEGRVQQRQIKGQEHQLAQPQQHHTLSLPVTPWDTPSLSIRWSKSARPVIKIRLPFISTSAWLILLLRGPELIDIFTGATLIHP